MAIGDNIKKLREAEKLTQKELADILDVTDKAVSTWERGAREPRMKFIQKIADHFGVQKSEIIENDMISLPPSMFGPGSAPHSLKMRGVPIVGELSEDIAYLENNPRVSVPEPVKADFAVYCRDESLQNARVYIGDIVLVKRQPKIDSGALAALLINGETMFRRLYRYPDKLVLVAENSTMFPLVYVGEDMAQVSVVGRVVAFYSNLY